MMKATTNETAGESIEFDRHCYQTVTYTQQHRCVWISTNTDFSIATDNSSHMLVHCSSGYFWAHFLFLRSMKSMLTTAGSSNVHHRWGSAELATGIMMCTAAAGESISGGRRDPPSFTMTRQVGMTMALPWQVADRARAALKVKHSEVDPAIWTLITELCLKVRRQCR